MKLREKYGRESFSARIWMVYITATIRQKQKEDEKKEKNRQQIQFQYTLQDYGLVNVTFSCRCSSPPPSSYLAGLCNDVVGAKQVVAKKEAIVGVGIFFSFLSSFLFYFIAVIQI